MRAAAVGLGTLLALTLGSVPSTASAVELKPEWGSVSAKDGILKRGCRSYEYSYSVTAPEDGDWDLDVDLVAPGGRAVWNGYLYEGANAAQGTATFRLCRSKVKPGRYKLKAVVSVQDGDDNQAGRLPTARFRLSRPR